MRKEAAMATLFVAPGWSCPKLLEGNANNLAWQDSADISLDGKTVSFMESSLDALGWELGSGADGASLTEYQRGPSRGRAPAWNVRFYNAYVNEDFKSCKAKLFPYTSGTVWE